MMLNVRSLTKAGRQSSQGRRQAASVTMNAVSPSQSITDGDYRARIVQKIGDAHCHAQLDPCSHDKIQSCQARKMALMSVSSHDWPHVKQLSRDRAGHIIPAFGIHPWKAHLYSSDCYTMTVADTLDTAKLDDAQRAALPTETQKSLIQGWSDELERYLDENPLSIVGEFGIDRAARVPGTPCSTKYDHQWALCEAQMCLAARFARPVLRPEQRSSKVSLHCVQAYGHLRDYLAHLPAHEAPPRIMLHSYGGSPDMVKSFVSLPHRLYFSFSSVLCLKSPKKAAQRVAAVPDDRLLLETDLTEIDPMNEALIDIAQFVADAKGWSVDYTVEKTWSNFEEFFSWHAESKMGS